MTDNFEFERAFATFQAMLVLRAEHRSEAMEYLADREFWRLAATPPSTIAGAIRKGRAFLAEYGETGELRTDLVERLLEDVEALT